MIDHRVGGEVMDRLTGLTPRGTLLRHKGNGYFEIVELPVEMPKVGDVIDTEAAAKLLPVGSVVLEEPGRFSMMSSAHEGQRPAVKVKRGCWMYSGWDDEPETMDDKILVDQPHRVIYVPDADASTGRTAA